MCSAITPSPAGSSSVGSSGDGTNNQKLSEQWAEQGGATEAGWAPSYDEDTLMQTLTPDQVSNHSNLDLTHLQRSLQW
jgi:uncharacterized protein (DUF2235 family)